MHFKRVSLTQLVGRRLDTAAHPNCTDESHAARHDRRHTVEHCGRVMCANTTRNRAQRPGFRAPPAKVVLHVMPVLPRTTGARVVGFQDQALCPRGVCMWGAGSRRGAPSGEWGLTERIREVDSEAHVLGFAHVLALDSPRSSYTPAPIAPLALPKCA